MMRIMKKKKKKKNGQLMDSANLFADPKLQCGTTQQSHVLAGMIYLGFSKRSAYKQGFVFCFGPNL